MADYLNEYLVRLGWDIDGESIAHVKSALTTTEHAVSDSAGRMSNAILSFPKALINSVPIIGNALTSTAKNILEFQGAVIGSFTAVSGALLGLIDKTAQADQQYRLLGLSMFMGTETARKMAIITDTLGASLEQIIWDPELHARALILAQDIDNLTGKLGADFGPGMKSIRDFRFEISRLEVGVQFLGMRFANDLWKAIAPKLGAKDFHQWITDMEDRIPGLSKKLTGYAVPALEMTWRMTKELGYVLEQGTIAFTNMIGVLSGDTKIQGTALSFDKLAGAIQHVGEWMVQLFDWLARGELALAHFATGVVLLFEKKWGAAGKEFHTGVEELKGTSPQERNRQTINFATATALGLPAGTQFVQKPDETEDYGLSKFDGKSIGDVVGQMFTQMVGSLGEKLKGTELQIGKDLGSALIHGATGMITDAIGNQLGFAPSKGGGKGGGMNAPYKQADGDTFAQRWAGSDVGAWVTGYAVPALEKTLFGSALAYGFGATGFAENWLKSFLQDRAASVAAQTGQPAPPIADHPLASNLSRADLMSIIRADADKYNVSQALALAVALQESGINQSRVSQKGAIGIMQLMPDTAKGLGVNPFDAIQNIEGGVMYLHQLLERYHGDESKAIAAYNAGPDRVDSGALPKETQDYVPSVKRYEQMFTPVPPAILPPGSSLRPLWLAPPANDSGASPITQAAYHMPDWAPALRDEMDRPVTGGQGGNTVSVSRTSQMGDINVHIMQPNANVDEIKRAVLDAVQERQDALDQVITAQLVANYA